MDVFENEKIQKTWDNMSSMYEENYEMSTMQSIVTCAVMTKIWDADRVLEVACGPGKHSLLLA